MASMTLAEFIKRTRDELIAGVAEEILTTNPIWSFLPWNGYAGSGVTVNKEDTEGDSQHLDIGDTITAKNPSAVDPVLFRATTTLGDAEINDKLVAESASDINDVVAMEVASKSKSVGRKLQAGFSVGDGVAPNMNSVHTLTDAGQYVTAGGTDVFADLDALIDKVKSKDGQVDFIMCHGRDIRRIRAAYRALGGVPMMEVEQGNRTIQIIDFEGIPIFQNDWLSITELTAGGALTGGAFSSIYAGNFDDGTRKVGISMIYPSATALGFSVEDIGAMEARDESIYRVKSYSNFASFNDMGLARLTDNPA
jgi:hypothetical protein